jgi:hypothetical protein
MGLGPPCCDRCRTIAWLNKYEWVCPVCDTKDLKHLWEYPINEQHEIEDNTWFLRQIADTLKEIQTEQIENTKLE